MPRMDAVPSTTASKRARLDAALADPSLARLSNRALAAEIGVSPAFVDARRTSRPALAISRDGSIRRTPQSRERRSRDGSALATCEAEVSRIQGELLATRRRLAAAEGEAAYQTERADKLVGELRAEVERLTAALETARASASSAVEDQRALRDQVARYQSDLTRRRRREEHYVAQLCQKLVWMGWEADEAMLAMQDGTLVCPTETIDLTPREREMFREMWTEVESALERHYHNEWIKAGLTEKARADARKRGLGRDATNAFAEERRSDWINAQMDEGRWPWGETPPAMAG
jgi:hypothetical protein